MMSISYINFFSGKVKPERIEVIKQSLHSVLSLSLLHTHDRVSITLKHHDESTSKKV